MTSAASPLAILKSNFGYDRFRPLQQEIIDHLLSGGDALALMPTGGGKSLCYQLPALCLPGLTLVVSPLIALMKDQVDALNANGIAARFINSTLPVSEIELVQAQAIRGEVKLLYVAPERLAQPGFQRFLRNVNFSLIAIDEAHCISEWGHEFRPDYRNLKQLRRDFPQVPVVALTATATEQVRRDIIDQLELQRGKVFRSSFNRANLTYSVQTKDGYWGKLLTLLQEHRGESAIIYCFSRRETEELAEDLNARGLTARPYHAGLTPEIRRRTQEDFIRDRAPVIVATIAFGMGIDKPDIRLVVHHSLPKSLEGYYQETGRAGRDGIPSDCVLFYSHADKIKQEHFINQIEDRTEKLNARRKLAQMVDFAEIPVCRRRTLLGYFGEEWDAENCDGCDICLTSGETFDATEVAQKIMSAIIRTGERFGALHVSRVLRGSQEKRLRELGHDRLSVYGIAQDLNYAELREIFGLLQARGLLVRNEGEYASLAVTPEGRDFLRQRQKLFLPRLKASAENDNTSSLPARKSPDRRPPGGADEYDRELFEALRALRKRLADAQEVPAFVVFGDVSLRSMAGSLPQSLATFAHIPGVGSAKLERYGREFVAVIRDYAEPRGLPDRVKGPPEPARETPASGVKQDGDRKPPSRGQTYQQVVQLLANGLNISEIAQTLDRREATIIGHIERLAAQGEELNLEHLLPDWNRWNQIRSAFAICGDEFLKPVWEHLGGEVSYAELRLARVFWRQSGPPDE